MDDVDGKSGEPVELGSFDPSILEVVFPYILDAPGLNLSMKNIFTQMIIVLMISEKSPKKIWLSLREGNEPIDIYSDGVERVELPNSLPLKVEFNNPRKVKTMM